MSVSLPHPSARLMRAAAAEQADLARHHERLLRRRETLLAELRQLDDAVAGVDERLGVLRRLTSDSARPGATAAAAPHPAAPNTTTPPNPTTPPARTLRGPAIREVAVKVATGQARPLEALHYRRWYELLCDAGYAVGGKDPLAVFLTQLTRSPVVRKATEPGVYELDRQAPLRIRQRLSRLHAELREIAAAPQGPVDLAAARARRHELDVAISQQERALEEALRVLSPPRADAADAEDAEDARAG